MLNFAPGETSKTLVVLVIDNSYVDGNRTVNLALSNPTGATLSAQSTAVLNITDNDTSPTTTNPIDQARSFVQEHYYDFLGRYPDQSGWDFWTNEIASCGTNPSCIDLKRINVSAAYFLSIEFQQTGYLVERIYKTSYGSGSGSSTFGGTHQFAVPIVRFSEFLPDTQQIGTMPPAQFVDKLNTNAGNVLSASDRSTGIALAQGNRQSKRRGDLVRARDSG